MDRFFALFWHVSLTGHVVVTAGFLASTTAMHMTNVTRRIAKNFIVGLDSVLMMER
jgi:hypothetical protein